MSGWGMGPEPFQSCTTDDCDLFLCYDYRELSMPDMQVFSGYARVDLVAWSMGVWVAAHLFREQKTLFSRTTAVGGTLYPIDRLKGIPQTAFAATLETLNEEVLTDFYRSMFDIGDQADYFVRHAPARDVTSVQEELLHLKEKIVSAGDEKDIFSRKLVTLRDRIFPGRNQIKAWGKRNSTVMRWPHFPFYLPEFWSMLRLNGEKSP